jgi:hypothetical protein
MSDRVASGSLAASLSRRGAVRGIAAAAAALPAVGVARGHLAAQDADGDALGQTGPGLSAIEFVGKIDQRGPDFTFYGFVTHLDGLDEADLFTNDLFAGRNATAARFTLFGTATMVSRAVLDNLFVVVAAGELAFHFNEPGGADFSVPESFISGTEVSTATLRIRNVINVQAPQQGLADGTGDLAYATVEPFSLGDRELQLGEVGLVQGLTFTGQGTLLDPDLPRSSLTIAGAISTLG